MPWFSFNLFSLFDKFSSSQHDGYTLLGRLESHSGAINCLAFTRDGSLLASGADDETVRIWDVETLICVQVIRDSAQKWGQITCLKWLAGNGDRDGNVLCFGTGRGLLVTFRRSGNIDMVETGTTKAFMSGDSVEATAFDPTLKNLLVSSHYGIIRVYSLGQNDHLTVLWESTAFFKNEIPRALFLTDKGCDAIILGLEEGSLICCNAKSGTKKWDKTLNSSVASAALCSQERYVAIDNGIEGFDLYNIQRSSPTLIRRIPVAPSRLPVYYSRAVAFGEGSHILLCGTDHGSISVFELKSTKQIQNLVHEQGRLIQAIDTVTISRKHMIATGVSEGRFDICIWVKPDGGRRQSNRPRINCLTILNLLVIICALWATSDSWWRMIKQASGLYGARLLDVSGQHYDASAQHTSNPKSTSEFGVLDAETVVQLWRQVQVQQIERLKNAHPFSDDQPRSQSQHTSRDHDDPPDLPNQYVFHDRNEHVPNSQSTPPKVRVKRDERAQSIHSNMDSHIDQSHFQVGEHSITRGDLGIPVLPNQSALPIVFVDHDGHIPTSRSAAPKIRVTGDSEVEAASSAQQGRGVPELRQALPYAEYENAYP